MNKAFEWFFSLSDLIQRQLILKYCGDEQLTSEDIYCIYSKEVINK
jgi:hypothetical protein